MSKRILLSSDLSIPYLPKEVWQMIIGLVCYKYMPLNDPIREEGVEYEDFLMVKDWKEIIGIYTTCHLFHEIFISLKKTFIRINHVLVRYMGIIRIITEFPNLWQIPSNIIEWITGSMIKSFTALRRLDLTNNYYIRTNDLNHLTALKELTVNRLVYPPCFPYLLNLEKLDLSHSQPMTIEYSHLSSLTNLKMLSLCNKRRRCMEIHNLTILTSLQWLNLKNSDVIKNRTLLQMTNITALSLYKNNEIEIETILGMTQLRILDLGKNNSFPHTIHNLSRLTNLRILGLEKNELCSFNILRELSFLRSIYYYYNDLLEEDEELIRIRFNIMKWENDFDCLFGDREVNKLIY